MNILDFEKIKELELPDKKIIFLKFDDFYFEMKYSYIDNDFSNIKDNKIFGVGS